MDDERPSGPTIAAILGAFGLVIVLALVFMGGQVSEILSNVGNSIPVDCCEPGGSGEQGGPAGDPTDEGKIADVNARPPELLIIRTGRIEVQVGDLPVAVTAAAERIEAVGGYVAASEESADGTDATASVVYRVPADRWDEATAAVRSLASRVVLATVSTEEVTNQVVDLGARIANLRASEAAFQGIMDDATKIADVLAVQDQLTHVREEIERLVAQKQSLEEQAAFGTLTVVFQLPPSPAVAVAQRGWDPAADVDSSVGTLVKVFQRGISFGIWFAIVGLPILVGGAVAVGVLWFVVRIVRRRWADAEATAAG